MSFYFVLAATVSAQQLRGAADVRDSTISKKLCSQKVNGPIYHDHGSTMPCDEIVYNPSEAVIGKTCTCDDGKWRWKKADAVPAPEKVEFFGNVISQSKALCTIVDAIDCWQEKVEPSVFDKFRGIIGFSTIDAGSATVVPLTMDRENAMNAKKFSANPDQIMKTIKNICKVIDEGAISLPDLLPGSIGGKYPLLKKLLGQAGKIDFSDIFTLNQDISTMHDSSSALAISVQPVH